MESIHQFSANLYPLLAANNKAGDGNIAFSPFSISSALSLAAGGAKGNTQQEIFHALSNSDDAHKTFALFNSSFKEDSGSPLLVANALFVRDSLTPSAEFSELARECYNAEAKKADFAANPDAAVAQINDWVAEKTQGNIDKLVSKGSVSKETNMVLVNAIYFKAAWKHPFDKDDTEPGPWFLIGKTKKLMVDKMKKKANFGVKNTPHAKLVELPYRSKGFSFVVVLPNENTQEAWDELTTKENVDALGQIGNFQVKETVLLLPKFTVRWCADLKKELQNLGIKDAFSPARADFSGLFEKSEDESKKKDNNAQQDSYITHVIHQAVVDVNEEGTVAAAATAIVAARKRRAEIDTIDVNHPFLFLIRHKDASSGKYTTLFVGQHMC